LVLLDYSGWSAFVIQLLLE